MRYLFLVAIVAGLVGLLLASQGRQTSAGGVEAGYEPDFQLPMDYRNALVHYATIDRPDARSRDVYISPGAAEIVANNSTARLPNGTVIVIEAHGVRGGERMGLVENIHVAVKRDGWTAQDYANTERAGDWNYFSFDPETDMITTEDTFRCFDCHANNSQIDFIFSRDELGSYGQMGELQQTFCNRPDRLPCR